MFILIILLGVAVVAHTLYREYTRPIYNKEVGGCTLTDVPTLRWYITHNKPVNHLDVSEITSLNEVFKNATTSFDQDLSKWHLDSVNWKDTVRYVGAFKNTGLTLEQVKAWGWDKIYGITIEDLF